jgi:hypothetical protein
MLQLATPFLQLGLAKRHWTEWFVNIWAARIAEHRDRLDRCLKTWRSMIAFAWDSEAWKTTDDWNGGQEELFRNLYGLGYGEFPIDDDLLPQALSDLQDDFKRWAEAFLTRAESFRSLCHLLLRPVPQAFLQHGLAWLAAAVSELKEEAWRDGWNVAPHVLRLLDDVVNAERIDFASDTMTRNHLLTIARALANRQVPGAIAFYERLQL